MPPSLLRARGAPPFRLRLRFRAASCAVNNCLRLGPERGLEPRIPVIGCRICGGNVNDFGQILPPRKGRAASQ